MMVKFFLKKLLSCRSILEFDKVYVFINKVLFLCNLNYGSEKKFKHRGSIVVIRKMPCYHDSNIRNFTIQHHMQYITVSSSDPTVSSLTT
jgi:hypothetical protein